MDALCRVGDNQYAIVAYFPQSENCTTTTYRRVFDGINHKALKTTVGYISVEAGMVLCKSDAQSGTPSVPEVEQAAVQGLVDAYDTRRFTETMPEVAEKA